MNQVLRAYKGEWGLTPDGGFRQDPWIIIGGDHVFEYGFGTPPKELFFETLRPGVIFPGLVNAHVHLEYSLLKGKLSPGAGTLNMMSKLSSLEKTFDHHVERKAAKSELAYARKRGTFFFSEVSHDPEFSSYIKSLSEFRGYRFLELRGFQNEAAKEEIRRAREALENDSKLVPTPHSVYYSSPSIMRFIREQSRGNALSLHLLEAPDEWDLPFERGETYAYLAKQGLYERHRELFFNNVLPFLHSIGLLSFKKLFLIHLLHSTRREIDFLNEIVPHAAWVLCNRSVEFLGYRRRNWNLLAHSPLRMLIGTDTAALAGDISVLDEMMHIVRKDVLPEQEVILAGTHNAYEYFEIPPQRIPYFLFPDAKPKLESLVTTPKAILLRG